MLRRLPIALALALAVLSAACSPDSGTLEEGARQDELSAALLTEEDVVSAAQAPAGLEEVPPERANLTEDPDPRGPCGATVDALPVLDGAIAVFGRDDVVVVNVVLSDTGGLAERLVGATIADMTPGCPAFTKDDTPFDAPQVTELVGEIELGDLGDEAVAFHARGTVGDNEPVYGVQSLVRVGDALTAIIILSTAQVADAFVADLTAAAATRLAEFPGT